MPPRLTAPVTAAVVGDFGRLLAVDVTGAAVLHQHSNAVVAIPSRRWVLRIASAPDALDRITASVRVTRWLAGRGYPCVVPVDAVEHPVVVRGRIVSVWHQASPAPAAGGGGTELGRLLRLLHGQPGPPFELARFDDPFDDVAAAVTQTPGAMTAARRRWIENRIDELRALWPGLPFTRPWGLMHGDAHPNNEIPTEGGVLLGDWDHTAIGPREWDLCQVHYTRRRFRRPSPGALDDTAAAYGWDIRTWPGLDTVIAAREITGLSPYIRQAPFHDVARDELARRLDHLRAGDTGTLWTPPRRIASP